MCHSGSIMASYWIANHYVPCGSVATFHVMDTEEMENEVLVDFS